MDKVYLKAKALIRSCILTGYTARLHLLVTAYRHPVNNIAELFYIKKQLQRKIPPEFLSISCSSSESTVLISISV